MHFLVYLCALSVSWLTTANPVILHAPTTHVQTTPNEYAKPVPKYAKWGRLAVAEAARKYPDAEVVDYLYLGHRNLNSSAQDAFRLWLRGPKREFGVIVTLTYDRLSEQLQSIEVNPMK